MADLLLRARALEQRTDPSFKVANLDTRRVDEFPPACRRFWDKQLLPAWRLAGLRE